MAIIKTEAIVLKQFDLGEADKIITFYSKDYGKIRAAARGVRKSRSSISGLVLPFSYNYLTLYKGRSLYRINQLKSIFSFSNLREDLTKMAYASYMAEIIEKVGLEDEDNQALFSLLLSSYHQLLKIDDQHLKYIEFAFKTRILALLGINPELKYCISCNQELNYKDNNIFDIENGGFYCGSCYANLRKKGLYKLSGKSIYIMKQLFDSGLTPVGDLNIADKDFQNLDEVVNKFMTYHLDLKLKSFDFLNMIKNMG